MRRSAALATALLGVLAIWLPHGGEAEIPPPQSADAGLPPPCRPLSVVRAQRPPRGLGSAVLFNGARSGSRYSIGIARFGAHPAVTARRVLVPSEPGAWDDATVKDPFVIRTSTADYLYYSGLSVRDQTRQTWGVGMAVRSHERGAIWRRSPQPVVEPVENSSHPFPVVVRRTHGPPRRRWALFHAVRGRIVVSWSADGRTWRGSKTVLSSTSIPGGSVDIFTGDVRRIAGSWRLFFAYRPPGRKFTMAVASARRLGSRFVGVQRIRDPQRGDRFELASDAKAGDRRLRVQPRGATGGRVLAIVGTPAGWSVVHIRSIDRSGRATLDVPLAAALPAGSEGRPVTSASVSPRSLVTSTRDPLLLATAFQTIPGCLIEMSLLGRLRLDFQRGRHAVRWNWPASPLVPMGRPGSWNISSAENPVMVRRRG